MKSFFKILFIFFTMVLTFWVQPSDFQLKEIQTEASIQAVANEELALVSNNLYGGEIYSYQEENNQNVFGNSPLVLSFNFENNNFLKNNTRIYGSFIHNLSTNNQKVQQIRAP